MGVAEKRYPNVKGKTYLTIQHGTAWASFRIFYQIPSYCYLFLESLSRHSTYKLPVVKFSDSYAENVVVPNIT